MTADSIAAHFLAAARAISALPDDRPRKPRSAMPRPARDTKDAWHQAGRDGDPWGLYRHEPGKSRGRATRAEIESLDLVLGWRPFVPFPTWASLWAWAFGIPERRVMRRFRISRTTLWRWRKAGFQRIATKVLTARNK